MLNIPNTISILISIHICLAILLAFAHYLTDETNRRRIQAFIMCYAIGGGFVLGALGWNTLDWMMNTYAWGDPVTAGTVWWMNTYATWDWWNCFIFLGIVPFGMGLAILGGVITYVAILITKTPRNQ